jgi:chlorobactene glucosyltransferase
MLIWASLVGLVACIWLSRHVTISTAQRTMKPLTPLDTNVQLDTHPFVSVLVAAKDEEDNIEAAARTLLDQDYPAFELIVMNDRSTDDTRNILDRLQAEYPDDRLKVIHIEQLQEGWFGKNNAMREGVAAARGDWLCFSDADCRQTSTRALSTAVHYALTRQADFLSVLPKLETQTAWECIVQPVCSAVMLLWFSPLRVNDPSCKEAYANGAFMLLSRDCYDAIGGHEAVRTEVNEDMHMARRCKERGWRLHVVQNEGLYTVRMYTGLGEIWKGWSRIFYGCFGTFRRLARSMNMLLMMNVFPYLSFAIALGVLFTSGWSGMGLGWQWVLLSSTVAVGGQQSVIFRFYRLSGVHPAWAPTFIIGALVCIGMLGNALRRLGGRASTTWRGTTYCADRVVNSS